MVSKDDPAKEINVELDNYNCIMFMFESDGKGAGEVLGVIGDLCLISDK